MIEPTVEIQEIGGNCPVQATGLINGYHFYFRARGDVWSVEIYNGPTGPWEYDEDFGAWPAAGWMTQEEAIDFIHKAAKLFHEGGGVR